MRKKKKLINASFYATEEWDVELRRSFELPGDPYESSLSRTALGNLSVFAYRDESHGHFLFTEPARQGNLPEDFFTTGNTEFRFPTPKKFFRFQVELRVGADGIWRPATVPDLPELHGTRNARQAKYGDFLMWHEFNKERFLREFNPLLARI